VGPLLLESGLNFLDRAISDFFLRHVDASTGLQCQSALDWDPISASKRDRLVLRFERLAFAPSELVGGCGDGASAG